MKLVARIIVVVIANAVGLLAAAYWIPGFRLAGDVKEIVFVAFLFTVLNLLLKHILKLLLGPVIILTLGLGFIIVNAIMLKILDILSENLTILNIPALIYASLIISLVNFVFHLATSKS